MVVDDYIALIGAAMKRADDAPMLLAARGVGATGAEYLAAGIVERAKAQCIGIDAA